MSELIGSGPFGDHVEANAANPDRESDHRRADLPTRNRASSISVTVAR